MGGELTTDLARKLRRQAGEPERRMWAILHPLRQQGYNFRRQALIGTYYVDFACRQPAIVLEVDGDTHATELAQANDALRDDYLRGRGFQVLRFWNNDVMKNPDGVYRVITDTLADLAPPTPALPARGREAAGDAIVDPATDSISTSPLAGEVGRGGDTGSNPREAR